MNWPRRWTPPRDGVPGRARVFIYLALTVVFLLLSYQLILNKEIVSRWVGQGFASTEDGTIIDEPILPITIHDKELVLAAMRESDMSWVEENVPDWPVNIYRADASPGRAKWTVPINKGNEAMVYLTSVPGSHVWMLMWIQRADLFPLIDISSIDTGPSPM